LNAATIQNARRFGFLFLLFVIGVPSLQAQETLTGFDLQVKTMAENCRDEIRQEMEKLISSNRLSMAGMFDTFYIPIPNTNPQKFRTQYDKLTDEVLRIILDKYLERDKRLSFVVAVDRNGYLPTHNTKYSRPLTSDKDFNTKNNRTKRLFTDRTGLAAARSTTPYLIQQYSRDTGEMLADLSVPITIKGKHWGALRIGYKR